MRSFLWPWFVFGRGKLIFGVGDKYQFYHKSDEEPERRGEPKRAISFKMSKGLNCYIENNTKSQGGNLDGFFSNLGGLRTAAWKGAREHAEAPWSAPLKRSQEPPEAPRRAQKIHILQDDQKLRFLDFKWYKIKGEMIQNHKGEIEMDFPGIWVDENVFKTKCC